MRKGPFKKWENNTAFYNRCKLLIFALSLSLLSGCYVVKFVRDDAHKFPTTSKEKRLHFFLWGLVDDRDINLLDECPSGVVSFVESFQTGDVLFGLLSAGLYIPKHVTFYCIDERSQERKEPSPQVPSRPEVFRYQEER